MNILQLQYFQAVCNYKTVSAAAEYLHISQPSVSNAIKELEKEFGVRLFRRQHRGMELTAQGEALYARCKELLSQYDQTERWLTDLGGERRLLRLGVPPMIGSLWLPKIYREFVPKQKNLSLQITECGQHELRRKLAEDWVDMALLPHQGPLERHLDSVELSSFEIVCCAANAHPVAKLAQVGAEDLRDVPLVLFQDGFFQTQQIRKWFAGSSVQPRVMLQTEQLSTLRTMLEQQLGAGFLFRPLIRENEKLTAVPLREPIFVQVSLVWKKDSYVSEGMREFQRYARTLQEG